MAIEKVVSASITDSSVTSAKVAAGVLQPNFRNIIINGDMGIAQRATSASSLTSSGYHALDRFRCVIVTAGTWTISQSTTVPSGQGFATSMKWDNTTADGSLGASDFVSVQQFIEGQNLQYLKKGTSSAESLTVSVWVRSNKTGTYILELKDNDNTRAISQSYTISSADTWEKKELTFAGDTTGTLDNDSNASFLVQFALAAGSDYTSGSLQTSWGAETTANRYVGQVNLADSTSNEWYMTGLQVEVGTAASDFEFLPYDINLSRCERYCRLFGSGVQGRASNTTTFYFSEPMQPAMRASPTLTLTDTSFGVGNYVSYDKTASSSSLQLARSSRTGIAGSADGFTGLTGSDQLQVWYNLTSDTWLMATAEL